MKNNALKFVLLRTLSITVCTLPACIAIISYFPLWCGRHDGSAISGFVLLLFAVALVPIYKYIASALRSPSAPIMWFIAFLVFFSLSNIANEMTVICFTGFISNCIGMIIFKFADKYKGDRS